MKKPSGHGAGRAQSRSGSRGLSPRPPGSASEARGPGGQPKRHLRPAALCPAGHDRAAVRLDDALGDVEPEAGAAATAAAPELREHAVLRLSGDAVALVGDGDFGAVVARPNHDGDRATAVAQGVLDKVADDLRELVRIDPHLREVAVGDQVEPGLVLAGGYPCGEGLVHDGDDVDHLLAELEPAGLDA